jgi:predicted RNA-binding protein
VCFVAAPYGIVPESLSETYPLSQFEIAEPLDFETIDFTVKQVRNYISSTNHNQIICLSGTGPLEEKLNKALKQVSRKRNIKIKEFKVENPWSKLLSEKFLKVVRESLLE